MKRLEDVLQVFEELIAAKVDSTICTKCLSRMSLRKNQTNEIRCRRSSCRWTTTLILRPPFKNTNIKWLEVVKIIYYFIVGMNVKQMSSVSGHSSKAIRRAIKNVVLAISDDLTLHENKIGGEGVVVEIDESKFGKRKYERGRLVRGVWVLGGVEKTPERKIFLVPVERRNRETIENIISNNVHEGSIIHTDMWRGYIGLSELEYTHRTVNHSRVFVNPHSGVHTNTIEGTWSALKDFIPRRCRTATFVDKYLKIFTFLRNNGDDSVKMLLAKLIN